MKRLSPISILKQQVQKLPLSFALAVLLSLHPFGAQAQNVTLGSYGGQSSIKAYRGTITLTNGFNTNGSNVTIYIVDSNPPVTTVTPLLSSAQNYISSWTLTGPVTDTGKVNGAPLNAAKPVIQYFDGLGRLVQTVAKQGSLVTTTGASADLVSQQLYDSYGRDSAELLPYAAGSGDGSYKADALSAQPSWYNGSGSPVTGQGESGANALSKTVYEASPLDRVIETLAPGNSWVGSNRGVQTGYWVNTAADSVRIWSCTYPTLGSWGSYTSSGMYAAGSLYKNITTDEAGKQVIEFKDKDGHTVLKKVQLTATADNGAGSGHNGWLCTYYVYDDLGNLRCVIQPQGVQSMVAANSWTLTSSLLSEQCFRYEYDRRNRMIMKQVPGAGAVYMVYDVRDRLVMTQDADLRTQNKWIVTRYDNLNRADTTWMDSTATAYTTLLSQADTSSNYPSVLPTASNLLTATHYDDYNGLPAGLSGTFKTTWNSYFMSASTTVFPYPVTPAGITATSTPVSTKGLVTWTEQKIIDSTPVAFTVTADIYDDRGRVIQTQSKNITGGVDVATTQYSWGGQPLVTVNWQQKFGTRPDTTVTVTKLAYDDLNRLVATQMQQSNTRVNNGAMSPLVTVSQVQYDALGQVKAKLLGNRRSNATAYNTSSALETQAYDYNIRGWLLGVNRAYARDASTTDTTASTGQVTQTVSGEMFTESTADVQTVTYPNTNYFGFDLGYDKTNNTLINGTTYAAAQYTGNITGMVWKGANDRKVRKYDYAYDAANRLTAASFGQYTGHAFTSAAVNYTVNSLAYDNNGNIQKMNQYGLQPNNTSAVIDQLSYTYNAGSNKLASVSDAVNTSTENLGDFQNGANTGNDYAYDADGNLTEDLNKNISAIAYNYLNLPEIIRVSGKGSIYYTYDAAGNKLRKKTVDSTSLPAKTTVTMYMSDGVYQNDTLQFFGTSEGRARADGNTWVYDYFLKDHLGNTRMVITDDYNVASPILEATSYYPFGLQQKGIGLEQTGSLHNRYMFNGNELQSQEFSNGSGLDAMDFNARMYDQQLGVFTQEDPLTEYTRRWSPYAFSFDNPILFNDPTGRAPGDTLTASKPLAAVNVSAQKSPGFTYIAGLALVAFGENSSAWGGAALDPEPISKIGAIIAAAGLTIYGTYKLYENHKQQEQQAQTQNNPAATSVNAPPSPDDEEPEQSEQETQKTGKQNTSNGKTQWGWKGTKVWKDLVKRVGNGGTIEDLSGKVPTKDEAIDSIQESGGKVERIEGGHSAPNPHTYDHINYTTPTGTKGTIKIQNL